MDELMAPFYEEEIEGLKRRIAELETELASACSKIRDMREAGDAAVQQLQELFNDELVDILSADWQAACDERSKSK